LLSRWSGFQTKAIDTDAEFGAETLEKKSKTRRARKSFLSPSHLKAQKSAFLRRAIRNQVSVTFFLE
jgi:hypothetical protein